jgi:capsular polysaccharide biosynthesis protein
MNLNIKTIINKIIQRWYVLLLCPVLFAGATYVVQNVIQEKNYKSAVELIVLPKANSDQDTTSDANIRLNIQLMNTYMNVMKSTPVLSEVREKTKVNESVGAIRNSISLASDENSLSLTLRVILDSPYKSQVVANQIAESTQRYLETLFPENKLIVLNPAEQGRMVRNNMAIVLSIVMGIWIALVLIILETLSQGVIRGSEQLAVFGFPVIGTLPLEPQTKKKKSISSKFRGNSRKGRK